MTIKPYDALHLIQWQCAIFILLTDDDSLWHYAVGCTWRAIERTEFVTWN